MNQNETSGGLIVGGVVLLLITLIIISAMVYQHIFSSPSTISTQIPCTITSPAPVLGELGTDLSLVENKMAVLMQRYYVLIQHLQQVRKESSELKARLDCKNSSERKTK